MQKTTAAVILAAGIGSRLRPLTNDRPKALVSVGPETLLGRAVRQLAEYGVDRVIVVTGYRGDQVQAELQSAVVTCHFVENARYETTQNSVSLAVARGLVGESAFFKLDGDVVFQPAVLARLDASTSPLSVAVDRSRMLDAEAMKVVLDADRRTITRFGKGVPLDESAGESIGIERIDASAAGTLFQALDDATSAGRLDLYYEDIYSELIGRSELRAECVDVSDLPWTEVDDFSDLERARALVAAELR